MPLAAGEALFSSGWLLGSLHPCSPAARSAAKGREHTLETHPLPLPPHPLPQLPDRPALPACTAAGDCFEYCSGTDMECGSGSMQGSFQVAVVDPKQPHNDASWHRTFDARIAPFRFILPRDQDD